MRPVDRDQHQGWLRELAAEDQRRRRQAEPELARGEAALRAERRKLEAVRARIESLEADLEAARQEADALNDS